MQTQHPQLQTFSLQQHQEKPAAIESEAYTKLVQTGVLKSSLPSLIQKAFD